MMKSPCVYIFLNKGLHMSVGKCSAQAAHAVFKAINISSDDALKAWNESPHQTIIVLEANGNDQVHNVMSYLSQRGYKSTKVIDEGVNEVLPFSLTALACEIVDRGDDKVRKVFDGFKKYEDVVKFTVEVPR